MERLEGHKIVLMIRHLANSQYTLNKNYQELLGIINSYESNQKIWSSENIRELELVQKEFTRLLHNYLASIFSLIGHTYAFRTDLSNPELESFCKEQLTTLNFNEHVKFLKDLRSYAQHYALPVVTATLSVTFSITAVSNEEKGHEQKLVLRKEPLLKWDRWTSHSRTFLNNQEKEIDIKKIVEEYQKLVSKFYSVFYKKVEELYSKQIEELSRIESEMSKLKPTGPVLETNK
jgi:hypothetical protein